MLLTHISKSGEKIVIDTKLNPKWQETHLTKDGELLLPQETPTQAPPLAVEEAVMQKVAPVEKKKRKSKKAVIPEPVVEEVLAEEALG